MKLRLSQSFVSQLWVQIILILVFTQVVVIFIFFLVSADHVGTRLGTNASTLVRVVDDVFSQAEPDLQQRVVEDINKDTFYKLIIGKVENTNDKLPYYPALRSAAKTVEKVWADHLTISYQTKPVPTIWLQKNQPPLFALGVPFVGNMFMQRYSLTALVTLVLGVLCMAWWVAKRISTPLHKLAEDAMKMGTAQQINKIDPISLDPNSCAEIVVLTDSLNKMRADISRLIKEREDYLAEISHDLRTPLSRLKMGVDTLNSASSEFVQALKADIAEMSLILKKAIELECADIDENEAWEQGDICQLLLEMQNKYQRAGITLTLDLTEMPLFSFKPLALTRLLYNLIDNGLQHDRSGQVTLSVRMQQRVPTLTVLNIAVDDNLTIDTLVQSASVKAVSDSNGLGLLIVQRIADLHGATVITNDLTGKGGREVIIRFAAL